MEEEIVIILICPGWGADLGSLVSFLFFFSLSLSYSGSPIEEDKLAFVSRFLYIKNHNNAERFCEY
jgi:hypothetical protein